MLREEQARSMLAMQAAMNRHIDPDWVSAAYPYLRAVVIEAAEAMEHHGWKWWKHQRCDLPQLQMEVIDIWHFLMSRLLLDHHGDEEAALTELMKEAAIDPGTVILRFDGHDYTPASLPLLDKLQLLSATAAADRTEIPLFAALLEDCGMDWSELFRQYTGKNVLNGFRQDHGYKEGHYRKTWQGREDNEHLVELMDSLDAAPATFRDELYKALESRYEAADNR
ncbi:MAG: dUTP diphosphatase [Pseudohongiellaceae bacterium]